MRFASGVSRTCGPIFVLLALLAADASAAGQSAGPTDRTALAALAGEYEAGTITITIALQADGTLTLLFPGQPLYHLQPQTGLRFAFRELAGFAVEFRRDAAGSVTQMDVLQRPPQPNFVAVRKRAPQSAPPAGQANAVPRTAPASPSPPAAAPQPAAPVIAHNPQPAQAASPTTQPAPARRPPGAAPARPQPASSPAPATAARPNNASANAPAAAASAASCDALAAHPDDDGKPASVAGAADEVIVAARAIPACAQAVEASPKDGRLHFQLGRAYWAAKRHGDAIDSFLKAEELKYAAAYFYLAEAYDYGLVEGEKADSELATALYALAAEGGFLPAKAMLGLDTGSAPLEFDPGAFTSPDWMRALQAGDVPTLHRSSNPRFLIYLDGMVSLILENEQEYGAACVARIDKAAARDLQSLMRSAVSGLANPSGDIGFLGRLAALGNAADVVESARQDGIDDGYLLMTDYGGCGSAAFEKVFATVKNFTAFHLSPEGRILAGCRKLTGFASEAALESYCQCAAPKIATSDLQEIHRDLFRTNFRDGRNMAFRTYPEFMQSLNASCLPK